MRICKVIVALLLVVTMFPLGLVRVNAEDAPKITVESKIVQCGSTENFQVSVTLSGAPNIKTLSVKDLVYDTDKMTYVNGIINVQGTTLANVQANGNAVITMNSDTDINGLIITYTFAIKAGVSAGNIDLSCTVVAKQKPENVETDISNTFAVVPGIISVSDTREPTPITDFTYTINGDNITLTKYNGSSEEVNIGNKYTINNKEYNVTAIGSAADTTGVFQNKTTVRSITIPEGIETIGAKAFWKCSALSTVIIPESVATIGKQAFYNCTSLTDVTVYGIPSIGVNTFGKYLNLDTEEVENVEGFSIHAWTGDNEHPSTAQQYAITNGITFDGLEDVKFRCYQTTDMNGENFKLRFVGTLDSLNYQSVGFEITETTNTKTWTSSSRNVYKELFGTTSDGTVIASKKATDYENSGCLFAATINGIPTGTALEFTVRACVINNIGAKVYDSTCNLHITSEGVITNDWN